MPQWDFLDFIAEHARRYAQFHLRMECEVTGLIEEGGRVAGVHASANGAPVEIHADLIVGADGRRSTVRKAAGLEVHDLGAPIDVLWMRLSKHPDDPGQTLGRVRAGRILVTLDRGDYWQCAYVVRKGEFEAIRAKGIEVFGKDLAAVAPHLADRVGELKEWKDVSLLSVAVDRLVRWHRPGLLCIGDAAHAMSPVGGVGINLAIQDAVAAANRLAGPLRAGQAGTDALADVQRRRTFPTRATQRLQLAVQDNVLSRVLASRSMPSPPWPVRLIGRCPLLQRIPARIVGVGFRPEHIATPDIHASARA
jgi:2-polyprenyl-6-methoxyphenol hydroxylase-like FAD-dependent oxidoreductase